MGTMTMTKTQSATAIKLAVATLLLAAAGSIALATAPLTKNMVRIAGVTTTASYTCSDTDGGQMPNVAGTVYVNDYVTGAQVSATTDQCFRINAIAEGYCANGNLARSIALCAAGTYCVNGACGALAISSTLPDLSFSATQGPAYSAGNLTFTWGNSGKTAAKFVSGQPVYKIEALNASGTVIASQIANAGNDGTGGMTYAAGSVGKAAINYTAPVGTVKIRITLDPNNLISELNELNNIITFNTPVSSPTGAISLALVSGNSGAPTKDQVINIGTTDISVFGLSISAQTEAQKIIKLTLSMSGNTLTAGDLVNVRLYRNAETTPFATANQFTCATNVCKYTWTALDNILPDSIQPGNPIKIRVMADIGSAGIAHLGDSFKFSLSASDVASIGAYSGQNGSVYGNATAVGTTYIVPFPIQITGDSPSAGSMATQAIITGTQLGRFKISNYGNGSISLTDLKFADQGSHTGNSTNYKLYYSDENSTNYAANTAVASSASLNFSNLAAPITLNGGAYRYFTVAIANIGGAVSGDSFSLLVPALGNVKYSAKEATLGYDGNGNGNLLDTITELYVDGLPQLGTLVKQ